MDEVSTPDGSVDPFRSLKRNFLIIGHRALSDGSISLKDLCGASGRWDGIARAITGSLFISHGMRRDTAVHIILLGPGDPPKILSVLGSSVKYLNPDERASSALMRKNLDIHVGTEIGRTTRTSPGIYITRGGLKVALERLEGSTYLLKEEGIDIDMILDHGGEDLTGNLNFILSDDREFFDDELVSMEGHYSEKVSVGPLPLHTYQTIIVVHSKLDRSSELMFINPIS